MFHFLLRNSFQTDGPERGSVNPGQLTAKNPTFPTGQVIIGRLRWGSPEDTSAVDEPGKWFLT